MTRPQAERAAWIIGSIGLTGAAIGWIIAPAAFAYAWLGALTAWLAWPLGSIGLVLVHALTGGRWGEALRPQLVAGIVTLPLLLPALIPFIIVLPALYPWARPGDAALLPNQFYLNLPFFAGRGILYLVVWFGLGGLILRALRRPKPDRSLAQMAPAGLIVLALTVTFASIDATMSLDPRFASSIYGLIALAEMGLLALAVAMFAATFDHAADERTAQSLGKLLLGLVILWAYLDFMQLLIVWQSDLATDAPWYVLRITGDWGFVAAVVAAGHFVLPFFVLLRPQLRRSRRAIAIVTALLFLSAVLRAWWLVLPASGRSFGLDDLLAMFGLLGIAAALALRGAALPAMAEAMRRHG